MPAFCRHNRFIQNCPICREPEPEPGKRRAGAGGGGASGGRRGGSSRMTVSRIEQAGDDGFRAPLTPGLRASEDAARLADELAFSAGRLAQLATSPPPALAEVVSLPDLEEAIALAFLTAYLSPPDDDPLAALGIAGRTPWSEWPPDLDGAVTGPRSAHTPGRGVETLEAYQAWASRAGSQAAGLTGESSWPPERRFARAFERLALPGLHRPARMDFLTTLGRTGRLEMRADSLHVNAGDDHAVVGAKRVFGIGDALLIDRRAHDLAEACELPFDALDLGLYNWQRGGERVTLGAGDDVIDSALRDRIVDELGL